LWDIEPRKNKMGIEKAFRVKDGFSIKDEVYIIFGTTSPTVGVVADPGSLYMMKTTGSVGTLFLKKGTLDTEWVQLYDKVSTYNKTTPPTVNDDSTDGYSVGSVWADITNDKIYVCVDSTDTAAVWKETTSNTATDLSFTRTTNVVNVISSNGNDVQLPEANTGEAGVLTSAKWNEIAANTLKVGYTEALVSANTDVAANTAKVSDTYKVMYNNLDVKPGYLVDKVRADDSNGYNGIVCTERTSGTFGEFVAISIDTSNGTSGQILSVDTDGTNTKWIDALVEVNNISDAHAALLTGGGETTLHSHPASGDSTILVETTSEFISALASTTYDTIICSKQIELTTTQTITIGERNESNNIVRVFGSAVEFVGAAAITITLTATGNRSVQFYNDLVFNNNTTYITKGVDELILIKARNLFGSSVLSVTSGIFYYEKSSFAVLGDPTQEYWDNTNTGTSGGGADSVGLVNRLNVSDGSTGWNDSGVDILSATYYKELKPVASESFGITAESIVMTIDDNASSSSDYFRVTNRNRLTGDTLFNVNQQGIASTPLPTVANILAGDDNLLTVAAANTLINTKTKSMYIEAPTASENITFWYTNQAITITKVTAVCTLGSETPNLEYTIRYDSSSRANPGTEINTGGFLTGSASIIGGASLSVASFSTSGLVPIGSSIWVETKTTSELKLPGSLTITVEYSIN
jgi:hypothetical protein